MKKLLLLIPVWIITVADFTAAQLAPDVFLNNPGRYVLDSSFFFHWDILTQSWQQVEQFRVTHRDAYGNPLKTRSWRYDPASGTWEWFRYRQQTFYDSITPSLLEAFIWDRKAGQWKMSDSILFSSDGKPVISWFKIWDDIKYRFSRGKRTRYFYDGQRRLSTEMVETFDTLSGNWKNSLINTFTYIQESQLVLQQTITIWKNNVWTDSLQIHYSYNDQSLPTEILRVRKTETGWINFQKTLQTFNLFGKPQEITVQQWDENLQQWKNSRFTQHFYLPAGLLRETIFQVWDEFSGTWFNQSRIVYDYNPEGRLITSLQQHWDYFGGTWTNTDKSEYSYDGQGNLTGYLYLFWDEDSQQWLNIYREQHWWSFFEYQAIKDLTVHPFKVYPNPVSDMLYIAFPDAIQQAEVIIHGTNGISVLEQTIIGPISQVHVGHLAGGTYLLTLITPNRQFTFKLLVQ